LISIIKILKDKNIKDMSIKIFANSKIISNIVGQNKANILELKKIFNIKKISFANLEDENLIEIYENDKSNNKIGSFFKSQIFENYLSSLKI